MTPENSVPGSGADREPVFADGMQDVVMPCKLEQLPEHEPCSDEPASSAPVTGWAWDAAGAG